MPTYIYETVPRSASEAVERFEVKQRFDEPALAEHPTTGQPVRRVISGGFGYVTATSDAELPRPAPGCGPDNCRCGRFN